MALSITVPGFGQSIIRKVGEYENSSLEMFAHSLSAGETMQTIPGNRITEAEMANSGILLQIGRLMRKIHCPVRANANSYMIALVGELLQLLRCNESILQKSSIPCGTVYGVFENNADASGIREAGLCRIHGQLDLSQLYFYEGRLVGVADSPASKFGSPYEDIVSVISGFHDSVELSPLYNGYGKPISQKNLIAFGIMYCLRELSSNRTSPILWLKRLRTIIRGSEGKIL